VTYMNDRRRGLTAIYFLLSLLLVGCGGALYRVAPLPGGLQPLPPSSRNESFDLGAAFYDGDWSLTQFDANLPMAGILPVELRFANRGEWKIDFSSSPFELRQRDGRVLKQLAPEEALRRVMRFYGNRFYLINAHKVTRQRYQEIHFPMVGGISPNEERHGILFFEIPREVAVDAEYLLTIPLRDQRVEIPLFLRPH
jgi:hypothetical protein